MANPDINTLRKIIEYTPETGEFKWKRRTPEMFVPRGTRSAAGCCANWNSRYAGKAALTFVGSHGYRCGNLLGAVRLAHRVAMAMIVGGWNFDYVDHINGDKLNNRACNLRACSNAENLRNSKARDGGSSRFKGVCWHKQNRNWLASITVDGRAKHIGSFENEIEAAQAYDDAARRLHGEFCRLNFGHPG